MVDLAGIIFRASRGLLPGERPRHEFRNRTDFSRRRRAVAKGGAASPVLCPARSGSGSARRSFCCLLGQSARGGRKGREHNLEEVTLSPLDDRCGATYLGLARNARAQFLVSRVAPELRPLANKPVLAISSF